MLQEPEWEREALDGRFGGERGADEAFVSEDLESLGDPGGIFAALANLVEMRVQFGEYGIVLMEMREARERKRQRLRQSVGGGDGRPGWRD